MIKINGVDMDIPEMTLEEYLKTTGYNPTRIAVQIGGKIIPKAQYPSAMLKHGDIVEIVSFVGGG